MRVPRRNGGHGRTKLLTDPVATAKDLGEACQTILDALGDRVVENEMVLKIEQIVAESPEAPDFGDTVLKQLLPSHVAASQAARSSWESRQEFELAGQVLAGEATLGDCRSYEAVEQLIGQELGLVPAKPEKVLLIGSGPLPLSGILIHQKTGAHVTCVDYDPKAIACAGQLLSKLRLDQALQVSYGYGENIQVHRYDLVVIALLANPKAGILANVRHTLRPTSFCLCRTAQGLRTLLYKPTDVILPPAFELVGEQIAAGNLTVSTMLLRPSPSQTADFQGRYAVAGWHAAPRAAHEAATR